MKTSNLLLAIIVLFFSTTLLSQPTSNYNWSTCFGSIGGSYSPSVAEIDACEGEETIISVRSNPFSTGCAGLKFRNVTFNCNYPECTDVFEPELTINYSGGSWSYESAYTATNPNSVGCPNSETLYITIIPLQSETLTISWQTVEIDKDCNGDIVHIYNYNFYGELIINVIPLPTTPILSTTTPLVQPSENIQFTIDNCEQGLRAFIFEECENFDPANPTATHSPYYCGNNTSINVSLQAPAYTTELNYQVMFERYDNCSFDSTVSNLEIIKVEEEPNINACNNNQTIFNTETDLQNQSLIQDRDDYHFYEVETVICTEGNGSCSVNDVWDFIKSDISYQAPFLDDFDPLLPFDLGLETAPSSGIIVDCSTIFIASSPLRIAANLALLGGGQTPFFNVEVQDPVKIVIDESCKCITNYTLSGHILHAGKVRRCVVKDDCGDIKVVTIGTGLSEAGETILGILLARLNESVGAAAFNNVSNRLKENYNN